MAGPVRAVHVFSFFHAAKTWIPGTRRGMTVRLQLSVSCSQRSRVRCCLSRGGMNTSDHTIHLTEEQRIDWLRLIRSDNVGPRGIMAQTPQA
jgi:hypothetical protein